MATTTLTTIQPLNLTAAKAFVRGSDTLATNGNATSLVYGSVNLNRLTVVWTDLADGDYDCILYYGSLAGPSDVLRVSGSTAILLGERVTAELDSDAALKLAKIEAATTGTVTGAGTDTEVFVGPDATLTITVDSSGNRSNVEVT